VEEFGPRTLAFHSFDNDLDQSFLLAKVISSAGVSAMDEIKTQVQSATDPTILNDLKKQSEEYIRLGRETVPSILFIFLMTKFEAYLEDILITVCQVKPSLFSLPVGSTEEEVRDEVGRLINNQRIDAIFDRVFEKQLNIPVTLLCKVAKTNPKELDKAKAVRNIHVHNRGIVNKRNKDRIGNVNENEYFEITGHYLKDVKTKTFLTALGIDKFVIDHNSEIMTIPWQPGP
jgi:hypothetical protein